MKLSRKFLADLAERVIRTFIVAAATVFLTSAPLLDLHDMSSVRELAVAALAAGGTAVLGLLTKAKGSPDTASILTPPAVDTGGV